MRGEAFSLAALPTLWPRPCLHPALAPRLPPPSPPPGPPFSPSPGAGSRRGTGPGPCPSCPASAGSAPSCPAGPAAARTPGARPLPRVGTWPAPPSAGAEGASAPDTGSPALSRGPGWDGGSRPLTAFCGERTERLEGEARGPWEAGAARYFLKLRLRAQTPEPEPGAVRIPPLWSAVLRALTPFLHLRSRQAGVSPCLIYTFSTHSYKLCRHVRPV